MTNFSAWGYVATETVTGSTDGAKTNFPVPITISYNSTYMRSDFGDIRFTLADGTELSYSIENLVTSDHCDFLVKIPSLPASPSTVTINIYAGNPVATTTSNPNAVYLINTLNSEESTDNWINLGGASHSISNGQMACSGSTEGLIIHPTLVPNDIVLEFDVVSASTVYWGACVIANDKNLYEGYLFDILSSGSSRISYGNGTSWIARSSGSGVAINHVMIQRIGSQLYLYVNGAWVTSNPNSNFSSGGYIGFRQVENRDKVVTNVKVLQTTSNPPSVGTLGSWALNVHKSNELKCITTIRSNLNMATLKCGTNIRSNHTQSTLKCTTIIPYAIVTSSLKCTTHIIIPRISNLKCTTNIRPTHHISSLKCVTTIKQRVTTYISTDFSGTLDSNIVLNQDLTQHPISWWTSLYGGISSGEATFLNPGLILVSALNTGSGNAKIKAFPLSSGFDISFDLGGVSNIFMLCFNYKNENDFWALTWQNNVLTLGYYNGSWTQLISHSNSVNGHYELSVTKEGLITVRYNGITICSNIQMTNRFTSDVLYIDGQTIRGTYNGSLYMNNLSLTSGLEVISTLNSVTNIRPNHNTNSLKCTTNIQSLHQTRTLKCISYVRTWELLRTNFDGDVLNSHLSGCTLDTVNHRLIMGLENQATADMLRIKELDTTSKGFHLQFDISLSSINTESGTLAISFNPINIIANSDEWWSLRLDKTNNVLTLIKSIPQYTFPPSTQTVTLTTIPYTGTMAGHYELLVDKNNLVTFNLNGVTLISKIPMQGTMQSQEITVDYNESNPTYSTYMDNLTVTYAPVISTLKCTSQIRANHHDNSLKCISNIYRVWTQSLTLQGSIFEDSPLTPTGQFDKLIFMSVNEVVFPDMIDFSIETRGNDGNTTFTITYRSESDLLLFSGQIITLIELGGDPDGFFSGVIQKLTESNKTGERVWTISGRNNGNPLVTQKFHIDAVSNKPTSFTSEQWLNMILFGSGVKLGPSVDFHVDKILNMNNVYNGFAGNWDTKAAALTELMALISKLRSQNFSWFLDPKGLLRIFYTDIVDDSVGIELSFKDQRILSYDIDEDAQSIVNSQKANGGTNNEFTTEQQNLNSQNGWLDTKNNLTWPGYGFMPAAVLQDSAVTTLADLESEAENVLELNSMPIFTINLILSKFPGVEIGQPMWINDHYKLKGHCMIITSITQVGNTSKRYTTITATNDKKILGPLNDFESVKAVAKHTIAETAPFYGVVMDTGTGVATIKPVDKVATINAKDLSNTS
ncbi:MAG: DUF2341 domain-containing protein [Methanobacterium paludis]|nr:DUF2341 domain-containing protein [Methanobacterium paludis]